ncbi:MAG TPA: STAS domain-containing protein [Bacteroidales bacterium]|nr:STAS domain-containing protein [Bacteroidales bacterium]
MVFLEKNEGIDIVRFGNDRINALNVDTIRPAIMRLFDIPHSRAVIDLSGVNYLDSTGFAMFLHMLRVARANYCTFRFCSLTPAAQNLFDTLQLNKVFDIYSDFDSCLQSFVRGGPA